MSKIVNTEPKGNEYKPASAFSTKSQTGRAQLWQERIKRAYKMLEIKERKDQCDAATKYIDGSYALVASGDTVYLNEALPALEDMVFGTVPKLPAVTVEARQMEQEQLADKAAALIDATLDSDLVRAHETIIALEWDDINYGIGIARMSWFEEETEWSYRPTSDPDYLVPHIAKAQSENEDPIYARISDEDDHFVHVQLHEEAMLAMEDSAELDRLKAHNLSHWARGGTRNWAYPVVHRVPPADFVYDPDAHTWEDRRWEAEKSDELVYDLQQIPGIKNLTKENCPPIDEFDDREGSERIVEEFDYENQRVKVWKIHDRVNKRYIIVPFKEGDAVLPLLEEDWPFGSLEVYNIVVHRPQPGTIHGISSLRLIQPILGELARTNAQIRRHNRRAAKYKLLLSSQSHKGDDKKFNSENAVEHVDPAALANAKEFKPPSLPKEILDYRDMLLTELRRILGSDIMSQGGDTPHRITASEAQLRGGYQQSRLSRRRQDVSSLLSWIANNIILMYRDFAEDEIPVRVMGGQGVELMALDPAAIPDDLVVKLDIEAVSEEQQQSRMFAAQTYAEMLSKIAQGMFDPIKLSIFVGERMGIPNPEKFFVLPEEPGGQAMDGGMASQPNPNPQANDMGGQPTPNTPQLQLASSAS